MDTQGQEYLAKIQEVRETDAARRDHDRHHRRLPWRDRSGLRADLRGPRVGALRQGPRRGLLSAPGHNRLAQDGRRCPGTGEGGMATPRRRDRGPHLARNQRGLRRDGAGNPRRRRAQGQPFGRTRTGKLVHLDVPARPGTLVDIHIEHAGAYSLRGTPVDALALV